MCGRYVSARTEPDLIGGYAVDTVDLPEPLTPSWNVAPTARVPMVRLDPAGRRQLTVATWGLVPSWAADRSGAARLINARVETVAEKPAFRSALRSRRCLLPADGYYEWARTADGERRPHLVRAAAGGGLAFAGLYETWRDPQDGSTLVTVTILTTAAAGAAAAVHDRMPVIVPSTAEARWLDAGLADPAAVLDAVTALPTPDLLARPANRLVGDVRNDGPHLLEPADTGEPSLTLF